MSGGVVPQELLGSPRWPPWMGTAAAGRRTDSGRWPETTRGVIRHSPQLGGCHLANKARRAFVLVGHSFAFARQSGAYGRDCRVDCLATIMDTGRAAPSGSWGGIAQLAAEVEQAGAELSRVAERLRKNAPSHGGCG